MKKLTAVIAAFILLLSSFSASALVIGEGDSEFLEKYDCVIGNMGDYYLVYKEPEILLENNKSVAIGCAYFTVRSESVPLYLVYKDIERPLESAVGSLLRKEDTINVVTLVSQAIEKKTEPLIHGIVDVELMLDSLEETASAETVETTAEVPATEDSAPESTEGNASEPDEPETEAPNCIEPTENPDVVLPTSWQPFTQASTVAPVEEAEVTANIPDKPAATQAPDGKNSDGRIIIENSPKNSAAALKSRKVKLNFTTATLKCGKRVNLNVKNKNGRKVTFTSDNNKIAKVNKKGIISTLKKGRAKITAKVGKKKLYCIVKVVTSPKLSDSKVKVKKGKTAVVKIIGRASNVKNKYKSTEYALIISKAKADKITVRGLKKGSTVLKIKVNGVILKLNVKVT